LAAIELCQPVALIEFTLIIDFYFSFSFLLTITSNVDRFAFNRLPAFLIISFDFDLVDIEQWVKVYEQGQKDGLPESVTSGEQYQLIAQIVLGQWPGSEPTTANLIVRSSMDTNGIFAIFSFGTFVRQTLLRTNHL
jgi:hypothetical protein